MTKVAEDALQRRIARFVVDASAPSAMNSYLWLTVASDIGQVRKDNQDRCIAVTASYSNAPDKNFTLAVVCDGIGGLDHGAEAAVLALSSFTSHIIRTTTVPVVERLRLASVAANEAVYETFRGHSGTTLSAVLMMNPLESYCVNVGDSRVYGISRDRTLVPLTKDDTLGEYVANPNNFVAGQESRLLQFIGIGDDLEPHVEKFMRDEYGAILLTSDGVHGSPTAAMEQVVRRSKDTRDTSKKLLALAEALGGRDNATLVSIDGLIQHRAPAEQGLTLTFLSPWDRLELWIPRLNDEVKQPPLPEALREVSRTLAPESESGSDSHRLHRKTKTRRRSLMGKIQKKSSGRNKQQSDPTDKSDTDEPRLNIDFPSDTQE